MKTTIYELLGMIKDGKPPKKIKVFDEEFKYSIKDFDYLDDDFFWLFQDYEWSKELNTEVEILDEPKEDKIEKVDTYVLCDSDFHTRYKDGYSLKATEIIDKAFEEYSYKINEIIDKLNNL